MVTYDCFHVLKVVILSLKLIMLCKSAMGSQTKDNFMYENGYGSQRNKVRIMPKSTSPISGWNGKGNESPKRELKLLSVITVSCASQKPKANEETNKQKTRHHSENLPKILM